MPISPVPAAPAPIANRGWLVGHAYAPAQGQPAVSVQTDRTSEQRYIGRFGEVGGAGVDRLETTGEPQRFVGTDLAAAIDAARQQAVANGQYGSPARAVAVHRAESGSLYIDPVVSRGDAGDALAPLELHVGPTSDGRLSQFQLFSNDVVALVDPSGVVTRPG